MKKIPHPSRTPQPTSRFTFYVPLFLFLFAVYLLTYTPRINSSDGLAMFSTAESLVRRGALDIEQVRWMGLQQGTYGLDGLLYSRKGIGVPIGLLPLAWLGLATPWFGMVGLSLLFNAIVTALIAVLLLAYLQELGFSQRTGLVVALTFGLATLAWPYAKSLFSDPFAGLLLLAAAFTLLKFRPTLANPKNGDSVPPLRRSPAGRFGAIASSWSFVKPLAYPFLAGLFLGWNVATRYAEAVFLPLYGLLLLYYLGAGDRGPGSVFSRLRRQASTRNFWLPILAFSAPIMLIGLGLISFNLSRYGDPFNTGYLPNETFGGLLWQGIIGQLVSPGRGLLLYCPIFSLSFWGAPSFFRRHRPEAALAASIILIHLLLYGKWFMWHGGYAWGPRFMIPTLPFWAIFLSPIAAQAFPISDSKPKTQDPKPKTQDPKSKIQNPKPKIESPRPKIQNPKSKIQNRKSKIQNPKSKIPMVVFLSLSFLGLIPQLLSVTIDFGPFQNWLLETGWPLFAPQTFFDPQYSPFLRAWGFISLDALDLAWAWRGQINGWLLAAIVVNIVITGLYLKRQMANGESFAASSSPHVVASLSLPLLACLSTLIALVLLLAHTHNLPLRPLSEALAALNEDIDPDDAVITNDPEIAIPFAELYQGRAPVLGLNNGGFPLPDDINRRLAETTAQHRQVWWLPNWLPPEQSAIEQRLLSTGFRARNDNFDTQRLALFAFPANLAAHLRPANVTFANLITLVKHAHPPNSARGVAFPVELQWQGLAPTGEDYHVFIHLLADDGQIVAQADGQPALWTRPTSTWTAGETIIDHHGLWIPPQARPGVYQLLLGLYHPADGQRLRLPDGADSVKLKVTIQ